jgi:alpha-galactosidase
LEVCCVAVEYADFPVVEWTVYLKNTGKENTPILQNIQGLDARLERSAEGEFVLHGIRGDSCVAESFRPYALKLGPDAVKRFSPPGRKLKRILRPESNRTFAGETPESKPAHRFLRLRRTSQ